jgi:hypothetical protein
MVVGSEMERSREMVLAVGSRAYHRWLRRQGYGACSSGRQPAIVAAPSIFLAEGRPTFFLPAMAQEGRQCCFCAVSAAWCSGNLDGPSGLVPGAGEIGAAWEQLRTRLRSPSVAWGPFCIFQGLECNFCFVTGPCACWLVLYSLIK